jgi:hypothetical protein
MFMQGPPPAAGNSTPLKLKNQSNIIRATILFSCACAKQCPHNASRLLTSYITGDIIDSQEASMDRTDEIPCVFQIPLQYNDGRPVEPEKMVQFFEIFNRQFGGHTPLGKSRAARGTARWNLPSEWKCG